MELELQQRDEHTDPRQPRNCIDCGTPFVLARGEITFFEMRRLPLPRRCEAGKITHSKMLGRYFNGDEGLLEQARTYAFPNAIARTVGKQFGGGDSELIFSVSAIENWRESLLQFAAALR